LFHSWRFPLPLYQKVNARVRPDPKAGLSQNIAFGAVLGIAYTMSAPDGIDPSKDIQPLVMLALRQDQRLFPFFHPDLPQLWMKTKPRFIRKKKDSFSFTSLSDQEFFLRSSEIPPPLPSWLEHTDKSVAAKKTLIDESIAELDAPSIEPHVSARLERHKSPDSFSPALQQRFRGDGKGSSRLDVELH
jgi:hypothetical protein